MLRILSNINIEPIKADFRDRQVSFAGYDQFEREFIDPESELYSGDVSEVLLFLDGEELLREAAYAVPERKTFDAVLDSMHDLLSGVEHFVEATDATVTINNVVLAPRRIISHVNANSTESFYELENRINDAIRNLAARSARILVLDWSAVVRDLGFSNLYDDRYWYIARVKLNRLGLKSLAAEYRRISAANHGEYRKVLVLDLDDTLWGGVVGEVGIAGIELAEDGIGKAYRDFQRALKGLASTGVLLAIASKNNPEDVREVFASHPLMLLRDEDFAASRVDWNPKAENILSMANELGLGLESFVFIDDNPVEREMVGKALPGIGVPAFPSSAADLKTWLVSTVIPEYFGRVSLTDEDRAKTQQYQSRQAREKLASTRSVSDYLQELEIAVSVRRNAIVYRDRIAQLTQKTNQFNLTGRRYTPAEIDAILKGGSRVVYSLEYADKFGNEGVVGAAILARVGTGIEIESFVLSCRVIGRNVEFLFLTEMLEDLGQNGLAFSGGADSVLARYVSTQRNQVAGNFLPRAGFVTDDGTTYLANCEKLLLDLRASVRVKEEV